MSHTNIKYLRAYTLVEILVVISIISLLLGILVPALNKARTQAQDILCNNHLREWGLAFEIYSNSNGGLYPHVDGSDRANSDADKYGWAEVLPPLMGEKSWRDHPYYERPDRGTIFQCPSARCAPDDNYGYRIKRRGYFSYAMNSCLTLDENCWPPNFPYHSLSGSSNELPSFLNSAKIENPYRVILLFDQLLDPARGYGGATRNRSAGKYSGAYPPDFSVRHKRKGKRIGGFILYCDYHVEWVETVWKDEWPDDLEVPPRNDKNWFPY